MINIPSIFNSMVFCDTVMRERLPRYVYNDLKRNMDEGVPLEMGVANAVAEAMRNWAVERGVTHYTHWFQPMTGTTAEKHESFLQPVGNGEVIMNFSGLTLVKGESDASSFPNGGLRATFEARGYTVWDTTSYAFIKDRVLCIPSVFYSYDGQVLDKKTPLLRSIETLNTQALRILKLFGNNAKRVTPSVGAEQEYFIIDKEDYLARADLKFCGRTLFGARPPKGQELDDHYSGRIKERISAFMSELDVELWKLGIPAKTKHNEVAPSQYELVPIYTAANIAVDQNQLTMELMKTIANRHDLACLLHERPFARISGSGKHNNWSLTTDTGQNLLEPGKTPHDNAQFLLFLIAVIKAVDEYQDLLRVSIASAGNDHRLGAVEAPVAITSIYLGEQLTNILDSLERGEEYDYSESVNVGFGVDMLAHFPRDTSDRNRTAPIAFTGNKFEFRTPGSALSIAQPNIVINTIVADILKSFADRLENGENFSDSLAELFKETYRNHKRIIFNGNSHSKDWVFEAERRGLTNNPDTVSALPALISAKSIELFTSHNVLSDVELQSRYEILLENYAKTLRIEGLTMVEMVKKDIIPAVLSYQDEILKIHAQKLSTGLSNGLESYLLDELSARSSELVTRLVTLEEALKLGEKSAEDNNFECARLHRDRVLVAMNKLREVVDFLEEITAAKHWTLPTYSKILYSVM